MENKINVWDKVKIKSVELENRIVRSATNEHLGTHEGYVTDDYIKVYTKLAKSGVGLLITSHMAIDKTQRADTTHICVNDSKNIEKLKLLTSKVHQYDSKIIAQISAGGYAAKNVKGQIAKTPSKMENSVEMTEQDISECIKDYVKAVYRLKDTGFDGVQLHLAHGYLLSEFLDPFYNKRTDNFGGTVRKRYNIVHQIMSGIQEITDSNFLVTVKIDTISKDESMDFIQDQIQVCKWLEEDGIDAIELSGSNWKKFKQKTPYFLENALIIKKHVKVPLILVGGFREIGQITETLNQGIDFIAMCRPFIAEEDFMEKLKCGRKSRCINCNQCFEVYRTKHIPCILRKDIIHQLEINFPN